MASSFKVDLVNSVFIGPINSTWDPQKSNKNTQRPLKNAIQTKYAFGYTSAVDVCASYIYIFKKKKKKKLVSVTIFSFQWIPCIVYETYKPFYSTTFSLKMGLMTLFTYLKIILLQYFQFSTN